MKSIIQPTILVILFLIASCQTAKKDAVSQTNDTTKTIDANEAPVGFTSLFNGENFDGWKIITDGTPSNQPLFSVEDGVIRTYPTQTKNSIQPFGALITTKEYENYILTLEYKWGEKKFKPRTEDVRDAGVLFHIFDDSEFWPSGAECQIQEGDTGDIWVVKTRCKSKVRPSNNNYGPDGVITSRGDFDTYDSFARSNYWGKRGWNKIEIEVIGNSAKFNVNGKIVNKLFDLENYDEETKKWNPLNKGKILLQAEGAEVYYRNIFIKNI